MRSNRPIRVLVVGLGNMGTSHAIAYHDNPDFDIVGLAIRTKRKLPAQLEAYPIFSSFAQGLEEGRPELCSINTYSDSHADYSIIALESGCHVFVEKPLATTSTDAERVVAAAKRADRKLVIGYILRHHPSWIRLIEEARKLGPPYVFRMNLNQQSFGARWNVHKTFLQTTSPIVDCGVHYVDVWCQITDAKAVEVRGMGMRMTEEIVPTMHNYGHMQVLFDDTSIGWFEAAWGPMISETAFFTKDVMSPRGSVSMLTELEAKTGGADAATQSSVIRVHSAETSMEGALIRADEYLPITEAFDRQTLCNLQQTFVVKAIREDIDLRRHRQDCLQSLRICLAADESVRIGAPIRLDGREACVD